jgi:hypothetical protein
MVDENKSIKRKSKNDTHVEYKLNPFCFNEEIKIKTKTRNLTAKAGTELIEKNGTNTETFFTNIVQKKEVDTEEFIKLFTAQIKFYFDLTKTAYKVFFIVLRIYQQSIGGDRIYLTCKTAQNIAESIDGFRLSTPIYYRGIDELIEKQIIAKSDQKYNYFINPAVIFNGDRARFVKEVIRQKEEIKNNDSNEHSSLTASETLDDAIDNVDEDDIDFLIAKLQARKNKEIKKEV